MAPRRRRQLSKKNHQPPTSDLMEEEIKEITDNGATNGASTTEKKESVKPKKTESNSENKEKSVIKDKPLNIDYENPKIEILGEVMNLMKSESEKNEYTTILQKLLEVLGSEALMKRKFDIISFFMGNLTDCSVDDLSLISEKCFDFLLPKELLKIVTNENDIIEEKKLLETGRFGTVFKGIFHPNGGSRAVAAIKVAQPDTENLLKNAAKIMIQLDHPNILKILAFQKKPAKLIMEYMECGDLANFILDRTLSVDRLYSMILNILNGMEYFSEKKFVHRSLQVGHIFVNSQFLCKIGDFSLSRYVGDTDGVCSVKDYYNIGDPLVAPELNISQEFTTKSDVWAMGLIIYEMFLLNHMDFGSDYYHSKVLERMMGISRFEELPQFPKRFFKYVTVKIMNNYPNKRPSFTEIIEVIKTQFI